MNSQKTPTVYNQDDLDSLIEDYKNMHEISIVFEERLPNDDPSPEKWTVRVSRPDDGTHLGAFDFEYFCKNPLSTYECLYEAYDLIDELKGVLYDSGNDDLYGLYVTSFSVAGAFSSVSDKLEITICDTWEYNKCRNFHYSTTEMGWVCQSDDKTITLGDIINKRKAITLLAKNSRDLYHESKVQIEVCPERGFLVISGCPKIPAKYKGEYKELTVENVCKLFKDIGYVAEE